MVSQPTNLTASVLRPADLLALRFEFVNLTLRPGRVAGEPPRLVRIRENEPAYLFVHFPPQHLAEETLFQRSQLAIDAEIPDDGGGGLVTFENRPAVVRSVLANPSRLVFRVPDDVPALPYTLEALLDWRRFDLVIPHGAAPNEPTTRLEIPYGMILAPSFFGDSETPVSDNTITWTNAIAPATSDGWTELWHTRIATKLAGEYDELGAPRVVETGPWPVVPFETRTPLSLNVARWFQTVPNNEDRLQTVEQTQDEDLDRSILANRFMLSSLGAWLDLDAKWDFALDARIASWRHIATMGRDQYVKVVTRGYLFPFGHRAVLVEEVRREFREGPPPIPAATPPPVDPEAPPASEDLSVAYLIRRAFIVVVEPEKDYGPLGDAFPNGTKGRDMPLRRVRLLTLVTPALDNHPKSTCWWPTVAGMPFPFEITAADQAGQWSTYSMPLRFLPFDLEEGELDCNPQASGALAGFGPLRAFPATDSHEDLVTAARDNAAQFVADYQNIALSPYSPGLGSLRQAAFDGQKLALAPPKPQAPDLDPSVAAARVAFSAVVPGSFAGLPDDAPGFLPILQQADVNLPAVDQLAGALPTPTTIGFSPTYLTNEFSTTTNTAQIFAEAIGGMTDLKFPTDKAGGVLAPPSAQQILGLSRETGTITAALSTAGDELASAEAKLNAARAQLGELAKGNFDPRQILRGAQALGIDIVELVLAEGQEAIGFDTAKLNEVKQLLDTDFDSLAAFESAQQQLEDRLATLAADATEEREQVEEDLAFVRAQVTDFQGRIEALLNDPAKIIPVPLLTTRIPVNLPSLPALEGLPSLQDIPALPEIPKAIETSYVWKPEIPWNPDDPEQGKTIVPALLTFVPSAPEPETPDVRAQAQLRVTTTLRQQLNGGPPLFSVDGAMHSFQLELLEGIVTVTFTKITFKSEQGSKVDFSPDISDVDFAKDLQFVRDLLDMLPAGLFGDGFTIDVSKTSASAQLGIAIPSFGFGIFSLENLGMSARLLLPFTNNPISLRFAFSERHNPFLVSVSGIGGTGFFALQLDTKGAMVVEAALEFGAQVALDVGVASGRVYIFAGIYFKMVQNPNASVELSGYVRAGGEVSVLGIASISIEFYIALTYISRTNKAEGSATVKACIELLFFSKCVSFSVRRQFAGSDGDPSFTDMMDLEDWAQYCAAYAA